MFKVKECRMAVIREVDRLLDEAVERQSQMIKAAGLELDKMAQKLEAYEIADLVYDNRKLVGIIGLDIIDVSVHDTGDAKLNGFYDVEIGVIYQGWNDDDVLVKFTQTVF